MNPPIDHEGFQRVPPHAIEAETCVIGAMLYSVADCGEAMRILDPEHFYRPAHQIIWQAMLGMVENRIPVDLVTLKQHLVDRDQYTNIGGDDYTSAIMEGVPSSARATTYAKTVHEKWRLRELIRLGSNVCNDAYATMADAGTLASGAAETLCGLLETDKAKRQVTAHEAGKMVLAEARAVKEGLKAPGLSTGFATVDGCIGGGFKPGQLVVVAADTSVGKSALLLKLLVNAVLISGVPAALYSAEMSNLELGQRLVQMQSGVNGLDIQMGRYNDADWFDMQKAVDDMSTWGERFRLTDSPMTVAQMRVDAMAMRMQLGEKLGLVGIDYLQILPAPDERNIRERIAGITRGTKLMAKDIEAPVLLLSQFSRAFKSEHREPEIRDLRESKTIEDDADVIILLHRPDPPVTLAGGGREIWVKIAKARGGRTTEWTGASSIRFCFFGPTTDYTELRTN